MIGRNKRGIRRASMRVRLAVAAAVLAGGGAAGVAAVAASHSGATAVQSAGYYTDYQHQLSEPAAISSAMNGWSHSPGRSLNTLSRMTPVRTFSTTAWHHVTLVVQRGTVVATGHNEFMVRSSNGKLELWHVRRARFLNVGGNQTGMAAMTGTAMSVPWQTNTMAKGLAKGDLVFVFGERENRTLLAQLVLFAAPLKPAVTMTPTAAPTMMTTPVMTATPGMTATPAVTNSAVTFSGNHS